MLFRCVNAQCGKCNGIIENGSVCDHFYPHQPINLSSSLCESAGECPTYKDIAYCGLLDIQDILKGLKNDPLKLRQFIKTVIDVRFKLEKFCEILVEVNSEGSAEDGIDGLIRDWWTNEDSFDEESIRQLESNREADNTIYTGLEESIYDMLDDIDKILTLR